MEDPRLSPRTCRELVRILQEILVNIRKHSGARHVVVRVSADPISVPDASAADAQHRLRKPLAERLQRRQQFRRRQVASLDRQVSGEPDRIRLGRGEPPSKGGVCYWRRGQEFPNAALPVYWRITVGAPSSPIPGQPLLEEQAPALARRTNSCEPSTSV